MNDKERILLTIFKGFYIKYILKDIEVFNKCVDSQIKEGDLVLATTSGIHDFTIGYVVERKEDWDMTLRELGSNKTCNILNEQFYKIPLDMLPNKNYLLEGKEYEMFEKVSKAFSEYDSYNDRFHSIDFEDDLCVIRTKKAFGNKVKNEYTMKYNSDTPIQEIVDLIKETQI